MSKELEALNILKNRISTLALNHKIGNRDIANLEIKDIVTGIETWVVPIFEKALTKLEELKRYPTADEVCKALIDYFKKSKYHSYIDTAYYSEEGKYFYTEDENRSLVALMFDNYYIHEIPPHLIILIGRFYEGVRKWQEN